MKKLAVLLTLCLLLPLAVRAPVSAQSASDWQVVVYADGANALQVLTADGVDRAIPAGSLPLKVGTFPSAPLVALSPDRRIMAALNVNPGAPLTVTVAADGTCCRTIRLSEYPVSQAMIGSFSPNGRTFAVSYLAPIDEAALQYEGAIILINVDMGLSIGRLDEQRFGNDYAVLHGWDSDGIKFLPTCYHCDSVPSGELSNWNPRSDVVTPNIGYYDAEQDTLAVTGETILPAHRPDFPLPIESNSNTQNVLTFGDDARVVFYNPNDLQINAAHWVADGWDVLIEQPSGDLLLDRTKQQQPLTTDDKFLVGTPDGWLGTRQTADGTIEVVHHTLSNLQGETIAHFYHPIAVLQSTPLGKTASHGGFNDTESPVSQLSCPNALPIRMVAGGKGRVVGGSVNLRREPSLTSGSITMITNEVFDVISGPTCDPTGIAWWEVGIGGLRGWMAEGKDGGYLIEPVLH